VAEDSVGVLRDVVQSMSSLARLAAIPRTLPFIAVRRRMDNLLTCPDGSSGSADVHAHPPEYKRLLKVLDRTTAGPSRRRQRAMTVRVHYNAQNRLTVELCIPNVARMWMLGLPEVTDEVYQSTA